MQDTTTNRRALGRVLSAIAFSGALALATGCHSNSPANSGPDPAAANMAAPNGQTQVMGQNASYTPQQQGESYPQQQAQYPQQAPAPIEQGYPQQSYPQQSGGYYPSDTEQAGEEALDESTQPPPPLPDYDQPPAPGPNYLWTPGYWAWGPSGYYWVPGVWAEPPYYGALWTPPYWGWNNGYYRFNAGYWGPHVGYYGGINYGFGYIGIGYFGGYWSGNNFYYNTAVTRVGPGIRSVYERPVIYNNVRYGAQPNNRVSYNGGRGGINVQARPTEVAAMRESHVAALPAQRQVRVEASQNRSQFYNQNHGTPAMAYAQHSVANPRGIAAAPRTAEPARPVPGQPNGANMNERAANGAHPQPNVEAPRGENRPAQPQPNAAIPRNENRPAQPQPNAGNARFENRPQPQPNAAAPRVDNRAQPQPQPREENRPQPQPQPQPRVENRPQPEPQPRVETRPQPQPQQHTEAPRPESHPAPQPRAQAPQAHAAPAPHPSGGEQKGDEHGHR
jgi:WXXGXW repeat (2 copies)